MTNDGVMGDANLKPIFLAARWPVGAPRCTRRACLISTSVLCLGASPLVALIIKTKGSYAAASVVFLVSANALRISCSSDKDAGPARHLVQSGRVYDNC